MLQLILDKITAPRDIFRLLAVNQNIANNTRQVCFKNIQELDIYHAHLEQPTLNGVEVKRRHLIHFIKELWIQSKCIKSLKLSGARIREIFETIHLVMAAYPQPLEEIQISIDNRMYSKMKINGLQKIILDGANRLEKFKLCFEGDMRRDDTGIIATLGLCMRLKEVDLRQLYITQEASTTLCIQKSIDKIRIHRRALCPIDCGRMAKGVLAGILDGLQPNITQLSLDLRVWSAYEFNQLSTITNSFPLLTNLDITTYTYWETPTIRIYEYLAVILHIFPNLQFLRIQNTRAFPHCPYVEDAVSFFSGVLADDDTSLAERKLRVSCSMLLVLFTKLYCR